ncbi:alpha-1,2-fucosyltransferase [Chitinophaga pollutisoli]|uniref:Alpha-1,2-fucosyltransferase n=1 Tax=Chitinophaga pollutisoli TaxID=3133966 RepID=A0ABZ2YMD0_9BACT
MITLSRQYGQTSNNFIQHIHIDAFCRANGLKFRNPRMSKYYKTYPNLRTAGYGDSVLGMKIRKALSFKPIYRFDIEHNQEVYDRDLLAKQPMYCEGWFFRSPDEVISRYIPIYKTLFQPGFDTRPLDEKYLQAPNGEVRIAVHIRRGDYKEWLDGMYYFEDDVYIDKIRQLLTLLGKPAKIIIFTNDAQLDLAVYQEAFGDVVVSGNSVAEDHYLMSQCDYILGPFSTFSLWASFIGETKFHHFFRKDEAISLERFRVCRGNWW